MLKRITQFVLPVLLAVSTSVYAVTPSYEGGSGLLYMRTADTVPDGVLDLHFRAGIDKFELEETSDSLLNTSLGVTYGLTNAWEVGVDLPFVSSDGDGNSGVPYFKIFTKARFSGYRKLGHSFGANVYVTTLASDAENEIGSGESGYGVELNLSLYDEYFGRFFKNLSAHFAIGHEKTDRKTLSPAVVYTSETLNKLSLGLEYKPSNLYSLTLEAIGTQIPEDDDENALLVPGFSYYPNDRISFLVGAALGLPDERSQPRYRVFAGVSYSFNKKGMGDFAWRQPALEKEKAVEKIKPAPKPKPEPSPFSIETDVHELPPEIIRKPKAKPKPKPVKRKAKPVKRKAKPVKRKPKAKPVKRKAKPKPAARPVGKPRVEIWNATGETGLAVKIGNRLRKKGYLIKKIGAVQYYRKATTIYFGPGFEKHAGNIAKAIWQEGEIESTYSLHNKVDIQIIIGTDMKKVWKIWNPK